MKGTSHNISAMDLGYIGASIVSFLTFKGQVLCIDVNNSDVSAPKRLVSAYGNLFRSSGALA